MIMGKIYLDRANRMCVKTDSGVFRSDGKHVLRFHENEIFEMEANDVKKLMVVYSNEKVRKLINDMATETNIVYSGIWQNEFIEIFTTEDAVKKIQDEMKSLQQMYDNKSESYRLATEEIQKNKNIIEAHNELPWYKRFKKIKWHKSKY